MPVRILAIDPGVTSGYCEALVEHVEPNSMDVRIKIHPYQWVEDVEEIWDRIEAFEPRYIICEDFEYRNKSRAGLVLFSVQAIGVVRLYEMKAQHQCAVVLQNASTGKGYYTDIQLERLEVYKRGVPHGMDATRHLLHWLTFGSGYQLIEGQDIKDLVKLV